MSTKAKKLNQVLAVESAIKTKAQTLLTQFHHMTQKDELLSGLERHYQPTKEDGTRLPPESKKLQVNSRDVFNQLSETLSELLNVTAVKDWTNCSAKADIVVGGETLLTGVPTTYLLFLDKQLTNLTTFVTKFGELSADKEWVWDDKSHTWRTNPVQTVKTEKIEEYIVPEGAGATKEHAAQVVKITKDVAAGYWNTTHISGALSKKRKTELLDRLQILQRAVKEALEEANTQPVEEVEVGKKVFDYLFKE